MDDKNRHEVVKIGRVVCDASFDAFDRVELDVFAVVKAHHRGEKLVLDKSKRKVGIQKATETRDGCALHSTETEYVLSRHLCKIVRDGETSIYSYP